jgi:hypothetical protein
MEKFLKEICTVLPQSTYYNDKIKENKYKDYVIIASKCTAYEGCGKLIRGYSTEGCCKKTRNKEFFLMESATNVGIDKLASSFFSFNIPLDKFWKVISIIEKASREIKQLVKK